MMRVLIVEDEKPAAEKLQRLLYQYDPTIEIQAIVDSVRKSVDWLKNHGNQVDLLFLDIQLTDGLSFDIFKQVEVDKPVIFTTAFNEYAIDAFKVNSIDYLLKPITFNSLRESLEKLNSLNENLSFLSKKTGLEEISRALALLKRRYKDRFMVKSGEHILSVTTDKVTLFFAEGRNAFLVAHSKQRFLIDYKLEELEDLVDPALFFRVNRSFIVNINSVRDVLVYSNSRLKVMLNQDFDRDIIVAREKVLSFKHWFGGIR